MFIINNNYLCFNYNIPCSVLYINNEADQIEL